MFPPCMTILKQILSQQNPTVSCCIPLLVSALFANIVLPLVHLFGFSGRLCKYSRAVETDIYIPGVDLIMAPAVNRPAYLLSRTHGYFAKPPSLLQGPSLFVILHYFPNFV